MSTDLVGRVGQRLAIGGTTPTPPLMADAVLGHTDLLTAISPDPRLPAALERKGLRRPKSRSHLTTAAKTVLAALPTAARKAATP
jgi:hypothetical protein